MGDDNNEGNNIHIACITISSKGSTHTEGDYTLPYLP